MSAPVGLLGLLRMMSRVVSSASRADRGGVRQVAVLLAQPDLAHLGAERLRHREELLVGRLHADHAGARLDQRVQGEEVGADRAVGGEHVVGRDALAVERRYGGAQPRRADDVPVPEPGLAEATHHAVGVAAHLEQLVEGQRVHAGLGDVPGGRRLVGVHPLLDEERFDVHGRPPQKRGLDAASAARPIVACARFAKLSAWPDTSATNRHGASTTASAAGRTRGPSASAARWTHSRRWATSGAPQRSSSSAAARAGSPPGCCASACRAAPRTSAST